MLNSLTIESVQIDVLEAILARLGKAEYEVAKRETIDALLTLWKKEHEELNCLIEQMTGQHFGMPLDIRTLIMNSQEELVALTVKLTYLCEILDK